MSKEEILRVAYEKVTARFRGYRLKTYTEIFRIFENNPEILWKRQGFLHCTQMNTLLEKELLKSGQFEKNDIKKVWTTIIISPHQYLKVRIAGDTWINVDPWSKAYGIPLGDYAHGFHIGSLS